MTDYRALLTDREQEILAGQDDVTDNYVHQNRHRIRRKIERMERELDILEAHHPELAAELRHVVQIANE